MNGLTREDLLINYAWADATVEARKAQARELRKLWDSMLASFSRSNTTSVAGRGTPRGR